MGVWVVLVLRRVGAGLGWSWWWIGSLGSMAGGVSGVKYGLGRAVGIWRLIDGAGGKGGRN